MNPEIKPTTGVPLGQLGSQGFDLLQELIEKGNTKELKAKASAYLREVRANTKTKPVAITVERTEGAAA